MNLKSIYLSTLYFVADRIFNPSLYYNSVCATCGVRFIQNNDLFKYFMDFKKRDKPVMEKSFYNEFYFMGTFFFKTWLLVTDYKL